MKGRERGTHTHHTHSLGEVLDVLGRVRELECIKDSIGGDIDILKRESVFRGSEERQTEYIVTFVHDIRRGVVEKVMAQEMASGSDDDMNRGKL